MADGVGEQVVKIHEIGELAGGGKEKDKKFACVHPGVAPMKEHLGEVLTPLPRA
jgi:hypothetical protein